MIFECKTPFIHHSFIPVQRPGKGVTLDREMRRTIMENETAVPLTKEALMQIPGMSDAAATILLLMSDVELLKARVTKLETTATSN
jgi:hypothetical protein